MALSSPSGRKHQPELLGFIPAVNDRRKARTGGKHLRGGRRKEDVGRARDGAWGQTITSNLVRDAEQMLSDILKYILKMYRTQLDLRCLCLQEEPVRGAAGSPSPPGAAVTSPRSAARAEPSAAGPPPISSEESFADPKLPPRSAQARFLHYIRSFRERDGKHKKKSKKKTQNNPEVWIKTPSGS